MHLQSQTKDRHTHTFLECSNLPPTIWTSNQPVVSEVISLVCQTVPGKHNHTLDLKCNTDLDLKSASGLGEFSGVFRPWQALTDHIVITWTLLSPASTLGLKQNICGVQSSMPGLLSAIVTFMTWQTQFLKSSVSWGATAANVLHLHNTWQYVQDVCGETVTHTTFSPNTGWTSGCCCFCFVFAEECYHQSCKFLINTIFLIMLSPGS